MRIDIYSDTICPWCYLGKRRFDLAVAARPQYEPVVAWRPFELNPDVPVEGVDRETFMAAKMPDQARLEAAHVELERQGEASGIRFRFDLISRIPNTRRSHLLIAHAARRGLQSAVKDRLMRAYFEEGVDIGELDELVRLAAEVGLNAADARNALILRVGQDGVVAAERHATVLGITGVPTYIFDGQYTISGAQEVGIFARVFDQVAEFASARGVAS
ncbi:MAG TPA: DsbA family oxidoreductase [Steroidobacteraceae bacterium]|jgi:predicted DsbA family dithiol-disulfide isomerase|nr:DsbA family oxidoreductase [Steroidobacteraceae bacterium]